MDDSDPTAGARAVAHELARMVARASSRGDLPPGFVQQLLQAPDHDGALAILLEVGDGSGGTFAADILEELAEGLITSAERVRRSRAVVPLLEAVRRHPRLAATLLAREDVLHAVTGGPPRPRLDRALVRVLEALAPLRMPGTVAAVVRRLGDEEVALDRLGRGATAILLESFDELAGLALGVEDWMPLSRGELRALLARLREDPVELSRLNTRCAEHGRARVLVAIAAGSDLGSVEESLGRSVALFDLLAPDDSEEHERAAYLRVVTDLMRLTTLQLLLGQRPAEVPAAVTQAWPCDEAGDRLPVGRLDRRRIGALVAAMDAHGLLEVQPSPSIW